jgi:abequosyltransferase
VRLSICIPTYNFGAFIGATLESIVPQLVADTEVVILDGGSSDDTEEVVRSFQDRGAAVRYIRRPERGGIDRDMARAIEQAQGEHCWIFCADDIMKPGAVSQVLERVGSRCEVYLCGFTLCDFEMNPMKEHPIARIDRDEEFDLSLPEQRRRYFSLATTTPAFFSFAGSLIVKRSSWEAAGADERFTGSYWGHVARILRMIPTGLRLHFIPDSLLDKRSDNDSFMDQGIAHRYAKAIEGYHRLADAYFPEQSPEARDIRRVVANEFPPWVLLAARRVCETEEEAAVIDRLAASTYADRSARNRLYRLLYRGTPIKLFAAAQAFNRRFVLDADRARKARRMRSAGTP